MQNRIRKKQCTQDHDGVGGSSEEASSSIRRTPKVVISLSIVLVGIILASCSKTPLQKLVIDPKIALKKALKKMCFSGEGKGRAIFLTKSNRFSYEALLNKNKEFWVLGLGIPLYGEEVIKIDFSKLPEGKVRVYGNFYQRLLLEGKAHPNGRRYLEVLRRFIMNLGVFLKVRNTVLDAFQQELCRVTEVDEYTVWGECDISRGDPAFSWKLAFDTFQVQFPRNGDLTFKLLAQDDNEERYDRINLILTNERSKESDPLMALNLYIRDCL